MANNGEKLMSDRQVTAGTPQMDWQQVALNGGPPCFHIEEQHYCGRAERWLGHGDPAFHDFVSLEYVTAKPLCPVHRRLEDKDALEIEVGNDCLACSLNERGELLAILAAATATDGSTDSVTALSGLVNERDALLVERDRLREALAAYIKFSDEAALMLDQDRDAKCLKLLLAMAGRSPRYRHDVDTARVALSGKEGE